RPAPEGLQAFVAVPHAAAFAASQYQGADTPGRATLAGLRGGAFRPFARLRHRPALRSLLIAGFGLDPQFTAIGKAFLLPERRLSFEVIHNENIGLERIFAMRAGG